MYEKVMSLNQATDLIKDGMLLGIGGNGMHRTPTIFSMALTQKPVKELKICGRLSGWQQTSYLPPIRLIPHILASLAWKTRPVWLRDAQSHGRC